MKWLKAIHDELQGQSPSGLIFFGLILYFTYQIHKLIKRVTEPKKRRRGKHVRSR